MGSKFKYVADESLQAHRRHDLPCPLCGTYDDVYRFYAQPEGGMISEACSRCIRSLPLEVISDWDSERKASEHLVAIFPNLSGDEIERRRTEICAELRRTPRVPLFCQSDEWPLCCGGFAEYVGRPDLLPEWNDFGGMSLFRCSTCGEEFEIFQHT
jgi:hypothetical protein